MPDFADIPYADLFAQSPNPACIVNRERIVCAANRAFLALTGSEWSVLRGADVQVAFAAFSGAPDVAAVVRKAIASRERVVVTGLVRRGATHSVIASPMEDAAGTVRWALVQLVDGSALGDRAADLHRNVSAARQAIQLLDLERRRLHSILDHAPGFACFLRAPDHVFELANPAFTMLVGRRELLGRSAREAMAEIAGQGYFELLDRVAASGEPFSARGMRVWIHPPDAPPSERYVDFVLQPVAEGGQHLGIFVLGHDVTEERLALAAREAARAEADQAAMEQRFLADSLPVQVWLAEPSGALSWVNRTVCEYFGKSEAEIVGEGWRDVVHPDELPAVGERWARSLASGEPYEVEFRLRRFDGVWRWHVGRAVALRDDGGAIRRWYGCSTDIHDRREALLERELLVRTLRARNQDLEHFAHVVSHDLKAPLRAMASLASFVEDDLGASVSLEVRENLGLIRSRAERMIHLVEDVLRYARAGIPEAPGPVSVGAVVAEVLDLLGAVDDARIVVATELPSVRAPRTAFTQLMLNLVSNARRFAPPTGRIEIGAERRGDHHRVWVRDDGPGIPEADRAKVWQRFWTSSGSGGSGVGLAIVKRVVEDAGGTVGIDGTPGGGATVWFTWPA